MTPATLPMPLRLQLEALRPFLERQGTLIRRSEAGRRPRWRLRVHQHSEEGLPRHRSIAIGDDDTAATVRDLLTSWRAEKKSQDALQEAACLKALQQKRELAILRRSVIASRGGGRCARQRTGREFDAAVQDSLRLFAFLTLGPWNADNGHSGRPRKDRLW